MYVSYPFKLTHIDEKELSKVIASSQAGEVIFLSNDKLIVIQKGIAVPITEHPLVEIVFQKKAAEVGGNFDNQGLSTLNDGKKIDTSKKKWAPRLGLDACIVCHESTRKHMGKGRCTRCYFLVGKPRISEKIQDDFSSTEVDRSFKNQSNAKNDENQIMSEDTGLSHCAYSRCSYARTWFKKEFMQQVGRKYYCCKAHMNVDQEEES